MLRFQFHTENWLLFVARPPELITQGWYRERANLICVSHAAGLRRSISLLTRVPWTVTTKPSFSKSTTPTRNFFHSAKLLSCSSVMPTIVVPRNTTLNWGVNARKLWPIIFPRCRLRRITIGVFPPPENPRHL